MRVPHRYQPPLTDGELNAAWIFDDEADEPALWPSPVEQVEMAEAASAAAAPRATTGDEGGRRSRARRKRRRGGEPVEGAAGGEGATAKSQRTGPAERDTADTDAAPCDVV